MASVEERVNEEVLPDAHEPEGPPASRPFWLIGLALIGTIGLLFGAALLLDRQLRPVQEAPALPASDARSEPAVRTGAVPTPPALSLEDEIEAGYLHYWTILSDAYRRVDPSRLGEVMSGPQLARQQEEIAELQARGRAAKLDVDHRIAFVSVGPTTALIYDEYTNRSVFLDPATMEELPTREPPLLEKISYEMRKTNGTWKVFDTTRHE